MQVLILSISELSTEPVEACLRAAGHAPVRLEVDRFPASIQLSILPDGALQLRDGDGPPQRVSPGALWYRRARYEPGLPDEVDVALKRGVVNELRAFTLGMMASRGCFVLTPKHLIDRAELKPRQLSLAASCGLDVPATLTTTDPEAAKAFGAAQGGRVVTKLYSGFTVADGGTQKLMFTTALGPEEIDSIDGLDLCPGTFQEHLEKVKEYRVTVAGEEVFACSVDSAAVKKGAVDWRRAGLELGQTWQRDALPEAAAAGLLRLMRRLGLSYGAADFVLTPEGRCVFLEVNPAGEFDWMDVVWDRAISAAIAGVLVGERPRGGGAPDAAVLH